ncbi:cdc2-related kinase 8, putative [Trypanosoma equiperdum]|uniref:Protein kinase, putative n=4 Tax=Trypanozoon TaxID=39700 RepID=Q384V5_TRYB2|nr:cyclin-dependent protein kinase, putative [Trypanosoma brucei gambiense DAL972]XP_828788.1 protein kinase, putative [Trypanosoma brucei brucei TREU927]RHW67172.1 cdc2-related kinase 8 [Trypanosoma brucei equiperdum]SCU70815.1 cdc2-related kinase 8, putative [Trypanosoma equiperdum]EAN79676.1 protein kinase, putative [Trypanosoma brucei brucei TREU927]CBH17691.1 cyclin-dependent protein kinase, putative [Trypanosoma brucei gambiense DAL972]|eukprot:XP_011779955.1 cyclin-dependent protein kinase, putative [Trypanosoma brucei gambiense DAL972]
MEQQGDSEAKEHGELTRNGITDNAYDNSVGAFNRTILDRYAHWMTQLDQGACGLRIWKAEELWKRYERVIRVGRGSFGSVFIVYDTERKAYLTVKCMELLGKPGPALRSLSQPTLREVILLSQIDHPNVVRLIDYYLTSDGMLHMCMPIVSHDLVSLIRIWKMRGPRGESSLGRMPLPTVKCVFRQLLRGLEYLHRRNIIHRDLKPSNVMLDDNGVVKIVDFGWARFVPRRWQGRLTGPPCVVTYRPPEILLGGQCSFKYDSSIDIWSAGCILYEMLTGGKAFSNARNEQQALAAITDMLGSPSSRSEVYYGAAGGSRLRPSKRQPRNFEERCRMVNMSNESIDFLGEMLQLEPNSRKSASQLLGHSWFSTSPLPCEPEEVSLPGSNTYRLLERKRTR